MTTRKLMLPLLAGLATITLSACSTMPQSHNGDMAGMGEMKQCLPMVHTGNADADFIKNMIPHHQMAVDMSEEELSKGTDPKARQMATMIIQAQKKEISAMQEWLRSHGY